MAINRFGGSWTETKLNILKKYLSAYTTILKKYNFKIAFIDAFAGTGYIKNKQKNSDENLLFEIEETNKYIKGSAVVALETNPSFDKYIFIDLDKKNLDNLKNIINENFLNKKSHCKFYNDDANEALKKLCNKNWQYHRAIVFLDPFGMEVKWQTIELIATTKAIDLWILFPFGIGVNRLLTNDMSKMSLAWKEKLNDIFGTNEWENEFYKTTIEKSLFGDNEKIEKIANFNKIAQFYINRLKSIFAGVIDKPMYLYNSRNNPLFLFCFASGNEKGSKTAIKIAKEIMIKEMELK